MEPFEMDYLSELRDCELCEWRCGVDRLSGELGVCRMGVPQVASAMLHPAPPRSYTIFMGGCNFKCLGCQNWPIAHFPDSGAALRGFVNPREIAAESLDAIHSIRGRMMGADRIFFSGGSPTPSLPYVESVVEEARKIGKVKVNYDTNGFMTSKSLERVIEFADSITFDIKAYHDDVHRSLTGASVAPVLRNAKFLAENAKEKIWEFRVLLIPGINDGEIESIANFLSEIDVELPLNFLAFRPNFVLEGHSGATRELMKRAVEVAGESGLNDVSWSGHVGIAGELSGGKMKEYEREGAKLAGNLAKEVGCPTHPRDCFSCPLQQKCPIKNYKASRRT